MKRVHIRVLESAARVRPEGYLATALALGRREGNLVYFTPENYATLSANYPPLGLGDAIGVLAHPIARAIDTVAGTDLANCGGCAERQKSMNERTSL